MNMLTILCSIQRAMLGRVTPNLRAVYGDFSDDIYTLKFYYDQTPNAEEEELVKQTEDEFKGDFPRQTIEFKIITLHHPQRVPNVGRCIFERYEENLI